MNYWLMKTEPSTFGIDHLARKPKKTAMWDGVRNYQARNMLRDDFKKGDQAFLYHSSCEVPGVAASSKSYAPRIPTPPPSTRSMTTTTKAAIRKIRAGLWSTCNSNGA